MILIICWISLICCICKSGLRASAVSSVTHKCAIRQGIGVTWCPIFSGLVRKTCCHRIAEVPDDRLVINGSIWIHRSHPLARDVCKMPQLLENLSALAILRAAFRREESLVDTGVSLVTMAEVRINSCSKPFVIALAEWSSILFRLKAQVEVPWVRLLDMRMTNHGDS